MRYRVLIVEDDPMVAAIDRQYVESDPRFQVVRVCGDGGEALSVLSDARPDLIILDYYTPAMDGLEFVDRLHALGRYPAVIMVTSANDREMYRWMLHYGYHPIIIATKLDKINRSQVARQVKAIREGLQAEKGTVVIPFSASSKQGREEIYALLDELFPGEAVQ